MPFRLPKPRPTGPIGLGVAAVFLAAGVSASRVPFRDDLTRTETRTLEEVKSEIVRLSERYEKLSAGIASAEQSDRIVVDTGANQLLLVSNGKVVLTARCSTGSGEELVDPVDGRKWVFDTPRGQFRISSRSRNPLWRKPDWVFIEEGQRPPTNDAARFEPGVLGDYALGFGNGYFIHGTLYSRLIGQNGTHGCIRLGDEDLAKLAASTKMGTQLLIF